MADIATIISCGVAIIGVMQVVSFVVEVRPVVNEFQRLIDTVSISYRDTVFIPKEIVKSDTIVIFRNIFQRDSVFIRNNPIKSGGTATKVPNKEKKSIGENEKNFREKYPEVFGRKK